MRAILSRTVSYGVFSIFVAGCSADAGGGATKRLELEGSSWDARLTTTVTLAPQQGDAADCGSFGLSARIEAGAGAPSLLLGRDGLAQRLALRATEDGYESIEPSHDLPLQDSCLGRDRLRLSKLSLRGTDENGDGVVDTLSGSGVGTGSTPVGDVIHSYDIAITLAGEVDATPPALVGPKTELSPLNGLSVNVSEPLPIEASLRLEGTSQLELTPTIEDSVGAITGFASKQVLPFGGAWTTVAAASDFAEHPLTTPAEFRTLADPGLFAEDGFEGELAAAAAAAVEVVQGIGAIPAISGQRSLWVTSQTVLLHLKRAPGQTKLRARAQWFYRTEQLAPTPTIAVGVVGSSSRSFSATNTEPPTLLSEASLYTRATNVTEVTVPLQGDGADVIVGIHPALTTCWETFSPFCQWPGGLLLDDLRLE